jgi:predicted Zn-dependent peptidase
MFNEQIETTTLPNGVRVVTETVPHVQSASVGIWVGVGSRDETPEIAGITHFIEHMLFKGTDRRDAQQIALEIESRGGNLNAFTDKEFTCYYAKSLAEHADIVLDVLSDMLLHSRLDTEEMEREKNVVLEEIKRYDDQPEDTVHDIYAQTLWTQHPVGRPTIGLSETVKALTRHNLRSYIDEHYTPDRVVVSAAGNVPHSKVVEMAGELLGGIKGAPKGRHTADMTVSGSSRRMRKDTEQVHFCYGGQGFSQADDRRYVLSILDTVLGGNMSSRLFQEVREKRGLAYSIGSYTLSYTEGGCFTVYGGTSMETFDEVVEITRREFDKVRREGITADELNRAKMQIRGSMVLGLENMSSRMMRMGKTTLYFGNVVPLSDIMAKIERTTNDDIIEVANTVLNPERLTLAAIGDFEGTAE